jgi:RimJ/RimL family protein N-acetyltransferase
MLPAESHFKATAEFLAKLQGAQTILKLATEADSEFLLSLRIDPARNQNISTTSTALPDQVNWMRAYERRRAAGAEAYFLIVNAGIAVGSLRLYDYKPERDSFCWGSWIIRMGTAPEVAYQSTLLVYDLGFGPLRFARAHFDVRQANPSVWKFHEKMGARLIREDVLDRYYEYSVEDYRLTRARLAKFTQQRLFA